MEINMMNPLSRDIPRKYDSHGASNIANKLYITRKPVMLDDGVSLYPGDLVFLISLQVVQSRWYVYTIMFDNGIVMQSTWNSNNFVNDYLEAVLRTGTACCTE